MSKILRRPMFRGGPVDSRGTGITSGLMDGGRVGYNMGGGQFKTGSQIVEAQNKKPFFDFLNNFNFSAGMPFAYKKTEPFKNIELTDTSVEKEETPAGDVLSKMTDYLDIDTSSPFEGYENFEDLPKSTQNISSKTDFDRYKKEKANEQDTAQSAINAKGYLPTPGPEKGVVEVDDKGSIKLVTDPTGNVEQVTDIDAKTLMRENAELFKELLGEANEKKLKDARISDASDYLLKFFEGSQKEGATVGSSAADVAAFATSRDSRTERAKAGIEKQDQTAMALAINDYVAGKRSKEQLDMLSKKLDINLKNKLDAIDYSAAVATSAEKGKSINKLIGEANEQTTYKKIERGTKNYADNRGFAIPRTITSEEIKGDDTTPLVTNTEELLVEENKNQIFIDKSTKEVFQVVEDPNNLGKFLKKRLY